MAPSSPFAAWQPLWGSNLTEPRSGVRVFEEAAFPAVIASARAGQEAAFPAVVASARAGQEATFPAVIASTRAGRKPPSLPSLLRLWLE